MLNVEVAVINSSTALTDAQVQAVIPALQTQVHRDFAPVWGVDANLTFVGQGGTPAAGSWWLSILDDSNQAGEMGVHDLTSEGLPLGKVFAGSDIQAGNQWTVTASHELLELLADPDVNLCAYFQKDDGSTLFYAYEICDACEADQFGYAVNGTQVSDFVFPAWFEGFRQPGSTQFDFQSKIQQPFQLLTGGYISSLNPANSNGWTQAVSQEEDRSYVMRAPVGSRRERRRIPRREWLRSKLRVPKPAE